MTEATTDNVETKATEGKPSLFIPSWKRNGHSQEVSFGAFDNGTPQKFLMDPLMHSRSLSMPKPTWSTKTPLSGAVSGSPGRNSMESVPGQSTSSTDARGDKAVTVEHKLVSPGVFSTWVRVMSPDIGASQLAAVLNRCEETNTNGAIHVYLREKYINRAVVLQLKTLGYSFHHYVEDTQTFVYGKQSAFITGRGMINASAREMVGALVLSRDETQVLLSWEGGKWTIFTGFTMTRENVIDALRREIRSQVQVDLDRSFEPRLVGGWNKPAEKGDCINEVFLCFAVRCSAAGCSASDHSRWFDVAELVSLIDQVDGQTNGQTLAAKLDCAIEYPPGHVYSHLALRWLRAARAGNSWNTAAVAGRQVFVSD